MNKERVKGFGAGLLTAALVLGLGGTALASRSIQVDDGIAVTINGVPFTPKDANGAPVSLFAYNGTTYAPVRAFSEAAGLIVDYDTGARTARVETPDYAAKDDPNAGSYIGADKARQLALADAGVAPADARFLKSCLDWEDGKAVYEVEFCSAQTEYDYELDALTGAVLKKELDLPDFDWSCHDDYRIGRELRLDGENGHHGEDHGHHSGSIQPPADLITVDRAKEIAVERLGSSVYAITKCELDFDGGVWQYELELRLNGAEYECELNASTGEILKWERD